MFRLLSYICLLIGVSCMAQSFEPLENSKVFKKELQEKSLHIQTLEVNFTEAVFSSLLKKPKISTGRIFFTNEDRLRWEKMKPYSEVFISDGSTIQQNRDGVLVSDEGSTRIFKKMASLMKELLTASFLESTLFDLSYFENKTSVSIVLKPKRKSMAKRMSHINLIFNKQNLALAQLSVYDNSVDYVEYTFSNVKYNTELDSKLFTNF